MGDLITMCVNVYVSCTLAQDVDAVCGSRGRDFLHLNAGGDHQNRSENRSERQSARKPPRVHADREEVPRGWWLHATEWGENGDTHRGEDYQGRCGEKNSVAHLFLMRPSAIPRRRLLPRPVADVTTNCTFHQGCITFFFFFCFVLWLRFSRKSLWHLSDAKVNTTKSEWCLVRHWHINFGQKRKRLFLTELQHWTWKHLFFSSLINIHIHTNFEHVFLCVYYD